MTSDTQLNISAFVISLCSCFIFCMKWDAKRNNKFWTAGRDVVSFQAFVRRNIATCGVFLQRRESREAWNNLSFNYSSHYSFIYLICLSHSSRRGFLTRSDNSNIWKALWFDMELSALKLENNTTDFQNKHNNNIKLSE